MMRYAIPVQERWTVIKEWVVLVEAETQEEAIFQVDGQLHDDVPIEELEGVISVVPCPDDWDPETPCEVQEHDITVAPCLPDWRHVPLF